MKLFQELKGPDSPSRYRPKKATYIALFLAILWILFECVIFISARPQAKAFSAADYCQTESTDGTYLITQKTVLSFRADTPQVENITFLARATDASEVKSVPLTLSVRGYDPSKSSTLLTYRTQKYAVGAESAVKSIVRVDIPEQAGELSIEFTHDGYDYTVSALTFNAPSAVGFNFLRTGIVLALIALAYLTVRFRLFHIFFDRDNRRHGIALTDIFF